MIYAAILAGGVGKRIERTSIPKQFISIDGTPIIVRTLRTFLTVSEFKYLYVAVHKDWIKYAEDLFNENFSEAEINRIRIISGGKERIDSFINVVTDISSREEMSDDDILICHDSVRPFVRRQMIDDCIAETKKYGLAQTSIPATDTIFSSQESEFITGTLNRNELFNGQTPTGFNLKLLKATCESLSEEEKASVTGTTQLFLKLGHKLKIVKGHTSNFKITTDNDLDVAERMLKTVKRNRNIELLDCTLRDGGIVVGFDFGNNRMQQIKECLENSGVEYIECGYIDEKKGSEKDRTCFIDEKVIEKNFLYSGKKSGVTYVAMIDYGTFDFNKLGCRTSAGIDGIRLAFHKERWEDAIKAGKIIISKGYDLFIQPMVSMRYSDKEYRDLINICNKELPEAKGFYVVDSFGQMDNMAVLHKLQIADLYVSSSMKIGFHAHNNRQMAFSNACAFANYPAKHSLMLDSSIMGMGKGAGNLCSELMAPVLIEDGKKYNTLPFYEQISDYFSEQLKITPWGYSLDYYLSSLYSCTPSYINIFKKDERVNTEHLINLVKNIPAEKKAACDRDFAAKYLKEYFDGVK
ncbi:MAG: D-ribitol-5-phosphate cytidylyltransferase [Treponema sp.]|nr:D-ribitol-5-phosphate cytidylyltransferase [Treponema sp.]